MNWDPAVWKEPFPQRFQLGFRIWLTGGEIHLGKLLFRARWISR